MQSWALWKIEIGLPCQQVTTRDLVNHLLSFILQFLILLNAGCCTIRRGKATQTAESATFSLNMEEMYRTLQALTWAQIFYQTVSLKRSRRGLKPLFEPHVQCVMCLLDRFLIYKLPSLRCSSWNMTEFVVFAQQLKNRGARIWNLLVDHRPKANIYFIVCIVKMQNGARIPKSQIWLPSQSAPRPAVLKLSKIINSQCFYVTTNYVYTQCQMESVSLPIHSQLFVCFSVLAS